MKKAALWSLLTGLLSTGASAQFQPGLYVNAVSSSEGRGMLREAGPLEEPKGIVTEADFRSFAPPDARYIDRSIELRVDEQDRVSDCHDVPKVDGSIEKTPLCAIVVKRTGFLHALTRDGHPVAAKVRLFFQFWFNPPGAPIPPPPAPPAPPIGGWKPEPQGTDATPLNPEDLKLGIKGDFPLPVVTVGVFPDGRGLGCTIRKSSRDDDIDMKVCAKVEKMRFKPATDGRGQHRLSVAYLRFER